MSASTGAGIQELMAAETRASQIVAEARMGKLLWGGVLSFSRNGFETIIITGLARRRVWPILYMMHGFIVFIDIIWP
jgi:hypothetical protein